MIHQPIHALADAYRRGELMPTAVAEAYLGRIDAVAYAAAADTVGDELPLRVGARVRHARFGEGLVVGIERDGADFVVTVGFASVGRKRLSMQYAHLEEL